MKNRAMKTWLVLLVLVALMLACGFGGRPSWANYKVVDVSKNEDGERVEVVYYCISAIPEDTWIHCKQKDGVEEIEILEGHNVQIWTLSRIIP